MEAAEDILRFERVSPDGASQVRFEGELDGVKVVAIVPGSQALAWDLLEFHGRNHNRAALVALGVSMVKPKLKRTLQNCRWDLGVFAEHVSVELDGKGVGYVAAIAAGRQMWAAITDQLISGEAMEAAEGN
jgi:hypothetical protein